MPAPCASLQHSHSSARDELFAHDRTGNALGLPWYPLRSSPTSRRPRNSAVAAFGAVCPLQHRFLVPSSRCRDGAVPTGDVLQPFHVSHALTNQDAIVVGDWPARPILAIHMQHEGSLIRSENGSLLGRQEPLNGGPGPWSGRLACTSATPAALHPSVQAPFVWLAPKCPGH